MRLLISMISVLTFATVPALAGAQDGPAAVAMGQPQDCADGCTVCVPGAACFREDAADWDLLHRQQNVSH